MLSANIAFSQGEYLKKGNSGVVLGFGFSTNSNVSGLGAKIGYSVSGIFDLGLFLGRYTLDDLDLNAISIVPSLTYYAIKQESGKFPLSISFNLGYERDIYSGDPLKQLDYDMHGDYLLFGFNILCNINSTSLTTFQPYGSISYITGTTEISDNYGNSASEDNNATLFSFGISMFFETSPKSIIGISPGISISEDNTTFSITVGVILPTEG